MVKNLNTSKVNVPNCQSHPFSNISQDRKHLENFRLSYTKMTRSSRFTHKLYLPLHAINRLTGGYSLHRIEKPKDFTE